VRGREGGASLTSIKEKKNGNIRIDTENFKKRGKKNKHEDLKMALSFNH